MKQDSKDIVLNVTTEWEQYEVRLNFDVSGDDLVNKFANIMRAMTFPTPVIIDSLRKVVEDFEEDMKIYNNENNFLDNEYGTTD